LHAAYSNGNNKMMTAAVIDRYQPKAMLQWHSKLQYYRSAAHFQSGAYCTEIEK